MPLAALGRELHVEVPEDLCHEQAHLVVGEDAADAVAVAVAEGLVHGAVVAVEGRRRVLGVLRQPALRHEVVRPVEVARLVVRRVLVDYDARL